MEMLSPRLDSIRFVIKWLDSAGFE